MIVALDGPAASGKGTLGRRIAQHYGFHYLDTGLLYRAIGYQTLQRGDGSLEKAAALEAAAGLVVGDIDQDVLRTTEVSHAASVIATMPEIRDAVLKLQRDFAANPPGAVLDGRDIGTVVCPDADVKFFVTASSEARARRRFLEQQDQDGALSEAEILQTVTQRDQRDQSRSVAPLIKAHDAHLLDTTNLDIEAAFQAALEIIERCLRSE